MFGEIISTWFRHCPFFTQKSFTGIRGFPHTGQVGSVDAKLVETSACQVGHLQTQSGHTNIIINKTAAS